MADAWRDWGWSVKIGGPAYDDPGGEFIPNKYTKKGVVITHRGCIRNCPWCYVPKREGNKIRCLPIHSGNILQDSNLLACPKSHQRKVFDMLKKQRRVQFKGGTDARLMTDWAMEQIRSIDLDEIWFAYDSNENKAVIPLIQKMRKLGISRDKILCYVLVGFGNETISEAEGRCIDIFKAGALPFAQLYDQHGNKDLKEWKKFSRAWSKPIIYKSIMKDYPKQKISYYC